MCEVQEIRYVHSMEHADYPDILQCGCICAGHMEQDLAGAREREAEFKADGRRRSRWLSRQWRISGSGNDFLNADGFHIVVYRRGKIWAARIKHKETGRSRSSKLPHSTPEAAKFAAFDAMVAMKKRLGIP